MRKMIDVSPTKGRGKKENDNSLPYPGEEFYQFTESGLKANEN